MSEKTRYLANPDVSMHTEENSRAILYNADSGTLTLINATGLMIWKLIKIHPRTKTDIVAHLKDVSDNVPTERAEADVAGFLKDLLDKGLIGEVLDDCSNHRVNAQEHSKEEDNAGIEELTDPSRLDPLEGWPVRPEGKIYPYRGSSMKGTFKPGDFVETVNCGPGSLRRGDVIVFMGGDADHGKNLIVHRIVRIGRDDFITQGDNCGQPDFRPVSPKSIVGKVVARERGGVRRKVKGDWPELIMAKAKYYLRMAIHGIYSRTKRMWPTRLIGRVMGTLTKSPVRAMRLSTKDGPVFKWVYRNRTVAFRHGDKGSLRASFLARCFLDKKDMEADP